MIVDDTIATLYVDGVALNTRVYRKFGGTVSVFATGGNLQVSGCQVAKGLRG